jgi:hypothetical protein
MEKKETGSNCGWHWQRVTQIGGRVLGLLREMESHCRHCPLEVKIHLQQSRRRLEQALQPLVLAPSTLGSDTPGSCLPNPLIASRWQGGPLPSHETPCIY